MNFSIDYKANVITKDNESEIYNGKVNLTCNVTKEDLVTEKYSKPLKESLINGISKSHKGIKGESVEIGKIEEVLNQGYELEEAVRYLKLCNSEEKRTKKDLKDCEDKLEKTRRELVNLENKAKKNLY